jgi:putative pyruvate formate lyase activating enzyme
VIDFLAEEIGRDTYLNLMDQYRPCGKLDGLPGISRRISRKDWEDARSHAVRRGLTRLD